MKKILALLLALVMVFSLAACGGNSNNETKAPDESKKESTAPTKKQDETKATEGKTEPAEPITVTIGIPASSRVVDYETNAYTRWLEEATGYSIDFLSKKSPIDGTVEFIAGLNELGIPYRIEKKG